MVALIKDSCPWFFEMHELTGEHPNVVPAGLGNISSDIDMRLLGLGKNMADEIEALDALMKLEDKINEFET